MMPSTMRPVVGGVVYIGISIVRPPNPYAAQGFLYHPAAAVELEGFRRLVFVQPRKSPPSSKRKVKEDRDCAPDAGRCGFF